jgi:phage terminase large subunit-like protein
MTWNAILPSCHSPSADVACNFFEKILQHTQDEWSGKPFLLAPWEEEALTEIYGRLDDNGERIIQQVYLELPKKSGKTEFAGGLVLLELLLNKMLGCQVYGAAAAQRQALNVYRAARTMVDLSPILKSSSRFWLQPRESSNAAIRTAFMQPWRRMAISLTE